MNKLSKLSLSIIAILVAIGVALAFNIKTSKTTLVPNRVEYAQRGEVRQVESSELSPKELEEYYAVYKNPFVIYLRRSLDAYVANDIGNVNISETAVKSERKESEISGLDAFDKSYYKSKFIVVSINKSIAGGVDIFIAFQDKPDKIFYAWVYPLSGGDYELRAFNFNEKVFDVKAIEGFKAISKQFLQDKTHAL